RRGKGFFCFFPHFDRRWGMASGSYRNGGPKPTSKLDRLPPSTAYSTPKPSAKPRLSAAPVPRRGGSVAPAAASAGKAGGDAGGSSTHTQRSFWIAYTEH
ncbi:hypothetical protein GW17_00042981, partial [Ensete ventricosum]